MAKMKKIIVAGPLVKEAVYPIGSRYDGPRVRQEKRKLSSEAQQRMNDIYSWQKLELMLAANFLPGDLVIVLTYDDAHLPGSRAEAQAKLKYFRAKLSKARRKRGQELVMFWNEEHFHSTGRAPSASGSRPERKKAEADVQSSAPAGDGTERASSDVGRWHHHCVINATGEDFKELAKLWGQGDVLIAPLRVDKEKNYATLARYMCKEARDKPGQRSWSYTRNAKKPEVETFRVPDDTTIVAPKGSVVLEDSGSRTEYGAYHYIKYIGARVPRRPGTRAKRRRKNNFFIYFFLP